MKSRKLVADVVLALDDTESMKRYVEIGMGIAVGNDFTLHPDDHDRFGVVSLDHLFPASVIGVCTLKGKFAGQAVRNFVERMSQPIRAFHADAWSKDEGKERGPGSPKWSPWTTRQLGPVSR